jgi:hypothetical protein
MNCNMACRQIKKTRYFLFDPGDFMTLKLYQTECLMLWPLYCSCQKETFPIPAFSSENVTRCETVVKMFCKCLYNFSCQSGLLIS